MRAQFGRSGPFDVELGPRERPRWGKTNGVQEYIDAIGALSEAGVAWASVEAPHPSRQAYIENVQWFGEEVIVRI